jgi:hypothetical protein
MSRPVNGHVPGREQSRSNGARKRPSEPGVRIGESSGAPFVSIAIEPVDASMWPLQPALWFQPERAPMVPAWSGLGIERQNRITVPGFRHTEVAPVNRGDGPVTSNEPALARHSGLAPLGPTDGSPAAQDSDLAPLAHVNGSAATTYSDALARANGSDAAHRSDLSPVGAADDPDAAHRSDLGPLARANGSAPTTHSDALAHAGGSPAARHTDPPGQPRGQASGLRRPLIPESGLETLGWDPRTIYRKEEVQ